MKNWEISTLVGVALVVAGLLMMRSHVLSWRRQKVDPSLDESDRRHYSARFRRRLQTSSLIALLGMLIPIGDTVIGWEETPSQWALYWMGVLLLALWVVFLGIGDLYSTSAHSRAALARLHGKQRALEQQLAKMREHRSNGHHTSD